MIERNVIWFSMNAYNNVYIFYFWLNDFISLLHCTFLFIPFHLRNIDLCLYIHRHIDIYIFIYLIFFSILLPDYDNKTCVPCESNCGSCQDRPDYCTSCEHHLVMHEHKCYSDCPKNTYETEDYKWVSHFHFLLVFLRMLAVEAFSPGPPIVSCL